VVPCSRRAAWLYSVHHIYRYVVYGLHLCRNAHQRTALPRNRACTPAGLDLWTRGHPKPSHLAGRNVVAKGTGTVDPARHQSWSRAHIPGWVAGPRWLNLALIVADLRSCCENNCPRCSCPPLFSRCSRSKRRRRRRRSRFYMIFLVVSLDTALFFA